MGKSGAGENILQTRFYINNPRLDTIALKIIWERDQRLWKKYVAKEYPIFDSIRTWDSGRVRELLAQTYLDNRSRLSQARLDFRAWWNVVENRWYMFLRDFLELKIGGEVCFKAHIGISPISPRDVEDESFLVPLYINRQKVLRICAHETSHFFFYRKAREIDFAVQPDAHHLWLVSEVLVPLLFGDQRSINIIGQMPVDSYLCKRSLIERCGGIYEARLEKRINSEEFINRLLRVKIGNGELNARFLR